VSCWSIPSAAVSAQPGVAVLGVWTLRRLADYMAEQTGIRVEYETV
jgi:hypothetical protein